jgi:hypothetical protein
LSDFAQKHESYVLQVRVYDPDRNIYEYVRSMDNSLMAGKESREKVREFVGEVLYDMLTYPERFITFNAGMF